mmetsp:Transcript_47635/g.94488  ORF Transcript_47635/g.94488 Transcript_47635/m.94488 type:complete len:146 (-) Transcript_47635:111-548(-)
MTSLKASGISLDSWLHTEEIQLAANYLNLYPKQKAAIYGTSPRQQGAEQSPRKDPEDELVQIASVKPPMLAFSDKFPHLSKALHADGVLMFDINGVAGSTEVCVLQRPGTPDLAGGENKSLRGCLSDLEEQFACGVQKNSQSRSK